jgi:hypothetical protein
MDEMTWGVIMVGLTLFGMFRLVILIHGQGELLSDPEGFLGEKSGLAAPATIGGGSTRKMT